MSWFKRGIDELKKRLRISRIEPIEPVEKYDRDLYQPTLDDFREPVEETVVIEEYIPYGAVVSYDASARRHRDIESGQYLSQDRYKDVTREVRTQNLTSRIQSLDMKFSKEEVSEVLDRYYYLAEIDAEEASEYIREIISP